VLPLNKLFFILLTPALFANLQYTRKKYEVATKEHSNPIKQDVKKGELREFKKGDIFFNYGW